MIHSKDAVEAAGERVYRMSTLDAIAAHLDRSDLLSLQRSGCGGWWAVSALLYRQVNHHLIEHHLPESVRKLCIHYVAKQGQWLTEKTANRPYAACVHNIRHDFMYTCKAKECRAALGRSMCETLSADNTQFERDMTEQRVMALRARFPNLRSIHANDHGYRCFRFGAPDEMQQPTAHIPLPTFNLIAQRIANLDDLRQACAHPDYSLDFLRSK